MIIEPPQIYADWVKCFELLKEEDQDEEEILKRLVKGPFNGCLESLSGLFASSMK